ncbi:hypothetical protein Holit_02599 [Hollandina sp. SP2]
MEKGKEAMDAKAVLLKRLYGVKSDTFEKMRRFSKRNTMLCIKKAANLQN